MNTDQGASSSRVGLPASTRQALRRATLDEASAEQVDQANQALSTFSRGIIGFCLILLVLGILPATFVLWVCVMLVVFSCMRLRLQAQHLHQLQQGDDDDSTALAQGRPSGPVVRFIPGGGLLLLHSDPHTMLQQLNARLRQFDEEMGLADHETTRLMAGHPAAGGGAAGYPPRPPAVSEEDIAALPCFPYKPPRRSVQLASPSPSISPAADGAAGPAGAEGAAAAGPAAAGSAAAAPRGAAGLDDGEKDAAGGSGRPSGAEQTGEAQAPGGAAELTCPVCLDPVEEGALVRALPCLHQFHEGCITPWLRQQGTAATCPMCKTPVFR